MYTVNFTNVEVKISDGSVIKGKVNIRGDYNRLSDFLRHSQEQFMVIVSDESRKILRRYSLSIRTILFGLALETHSA